MPTASYLKQLVSKSIEAFVAEFGEFREYRLANGHDELLDVVLAKMEPEKLQSGLKAFGAGMMGERKPRSSGVEEEALHKLGESLLRRIQQHQKNKALQAQQRSEIARLGASQTKQQLNKLTPEEFEYWTGGYFERFGFRNVAVTTFSADFGVDVYMTTPDGKQAVVQCKQYKGTVGRPVVQQTYGIMKLLEAELCYVVTTGKFTSAAAELGERRDIILLDGEFLVSGQRPCGSRVIRRKNNQE